VNTPFGQRILPIDGHFSRKVRNWYFTGECRLFFRSVLVLGRVSVAACGVLCVIHPCNPSPVPTGPNPHWQVDKAG
jgi:hypothetical protein